MSEIEMLIIVLELFKLRIRCTVDKSALAEFNSDVLRISRESNDLSHFKSKLYSSGLYIERSKFLLRKKFLRYLDKFDNMYSFISGKSKMIKCYEL